MIDAALTEFGSLPVTAPAEDGQFVVDLDGFEGPIDVLLTLAREQKVDLAKISILQLADQYLAFIARARQLRLELAADYLVMAAWLAYLKSRLLLPQPEGDEEPTGVELAAALAFQLRRLEAMRQVGARLLARPQLGRDTFARGAPEPIRVVAHPVYDVRLFDLLAAYGASVRRGEPAVLHIPPAALYSMEEALERLGKLLMPGRDWRVLESFLPAGLPSPLHQRSAMAATFAASLELVRDGKAVLRQERAFGPVYLRSTASE